MTEYKLSTAALLKTLQATETEIARLSQTLRGQLLALRYRDATALEGATEELSEITRKLKTLLSRKMKQAELLNTSIEESDDPSGFAAVLDSLDADDVVVREIKNVRTRIKSQIDETHRLYGDLAFALHFASALDGQLIGSIVDEASNSGVATYGPASETSRSQRSGSFVNRVA